MNEKNKTGVIAIAALMAVLFFAIGSVQAAEVTRYFDNVEDGVAGWTEETIWGVPTADTLWHITETRANSGTHSWWYGQEETGNYDTGIANSGCLVSPVISLNGDATAATLEYWTWWQTEIYSGWDLKKVYVRPTGDPDTGTCIETLPVGECPNAEGETRTLDLGAYVGDDVQILFCFNTGDGANNEYEGWFVDDIKVLVDVPTPPPPIGGLEVNKTVWNNDTLAWVDEIPCAAIEENYTFRCEIHNNGTENLTGVRFWDIMSSSLEYLDNSARMLVPDGHGWIPDIINPADPENTFKQKYLHLEEGGSLTSPVGSRWHELYPVFCETYTLLEWHDTGDDCRISPCDQINMSHGEAFEWYHVDKVVYTLLVTPCIGGDPIYLESTWDYDYDQPDITQPVDTEWHEIEPNFCEDWTIIGWTDTDTMGILDFCDNINLRNKTSGVASCYHVEEVAPDIIVSREYLIDNIVGEEVELKHCETVIIEFNATVVENGYDCNNQFAKALNESSKWVYGNDTACVNAPAQSVYFDPSEGSAIYGGCVNYSLMVDACGIKSGDVYIDWDSCASCANCTWTWNPVFETTLTETVGTGWDLHLWFYVYAQSSVESFNLGTLTCCCDDYDDCDTYLDLTERSKLYGAFGHAKAGITWKGADFECIALPRECGDVNRDGSVDMIDVTALLCYYDPDCTVGTPFDAWAGDVVDCDGINMGDVGLLHNHVTYPTAVPPYTLNCCAPT